MPAIYQRNEVAQSALRGRSCPTIYSDFGRARASLLRRQKLQNESLARGLPRRESADTSTSIAQYRVQRHLT